MRPAFSSTGQAAAFGLLLLICVLSPLMVGGRFLPPREQAYASAGWDWGPYPWIKKEIFEETNDLDIVFLGSSHMLWGIDTPYVQEQLDAQLGRKSAVRSLCWGGAGFDGDYFVAKDLLAHRRVHTLVCYDESLGEQPNPMTLKWFWYRDNVEVLRGLGFKDRSVYYFAAMMGMPKNLMEQIFPSLAEATNDTANNFFEERFRAMNPENRLGCVQGQVDYSKNIGGNFNFAPFIPRTGATPADVCLCNAQTDTNFLFLNRPLPDWQAHFAGRFGSLARQYGCQLVLLHLPNKNETNGDQIVESRFWPELLQTPVAMIGIPGKRLFAGLSEGEMDQLYGDATHLNANGQTYFTSLITPQLIQLRENQPRH